MMAHKLDPQKINERKRRAAVKQLLFPEYKVKLLEDFEIPGSFEKSCLLIGVTFLILLINKLS